MSDSKQVKSFLGDTFKHTHQKILNSKKKRCSLKPLHLSKASDTTMKAAPTA